MPCPHYKVTIVQRSENQSAVAGAAYQSGENLYSEYDQKWKNYRTKKQDEIFYKEIMLPANAPAEYADRNKLWNAVESVENQWNSQLARRIIMALPKEVPKEQYVEMVRAYCQEQFVEDGMIADIAIHDKKDGNPHVHIMLTMRSMDEHGKWLGKCKKIYDLDEKGNRIKLPSGAYKSHRVNLTDWNDKENVEKWRKAWADIQNKYLEGNNRQERVDLRSYERQGLEKIPMVHMGTAAWQMEQKGIATDVGNLNREIKNTNALMASLKKVIKSLKDWLDQLLKEKSELLAMIAERKGSPLIDILYQYVELREEERSSWNGKAQLNGMVHDYEKVSDAIDYLKERNILTLESLDKHLSNLETKAKNHRESLKYNERRYKTIENIKDRYATYKKLKPIYDTYSKKNFKFTKERYYEQHREEIDAYRNAVRFLKANHGSLEVKKNAFDEEIKNRKASDQKNQEGLESIKTDLHELRQVRYFVDKVLAKEAEKQKAKSIHERLEEKKQVVEERKQEKSKRKRKD